MHFEFEKHFNRVLVCLHLCVASKLKYFYVSELCPRQIGHNTKLIA